MHYLAKMSNTSGGIPPVKKTAEKSKKTTKKCHKTTKKCPKRPKMLKNSLFSLIFRNIRQEAIAAIGTNVFVPGANIRLDARGCFYRLRP
ncbi:MAG TPA: hypothetical protein PKM67_06030 [Kiritimatiellia bacterium]|nr:hypothetical protein [Kiritimatiellia bacterium]HNR93494.1 hypothetical protein [Kiritimatiellia bacterium]HNS80998.1 hypothetical protein [Kiritimatiellia bacterium]HPA78006.1 hypothetical protein [Kiritimatiellia bacterium]HQQ04695.1 hypothetical protein [Kiritimatiellia bacterium]